MGCAALRQSINYARKITCPTVRLCVNECVNECVSECVCVWCVRAGYDQTLLWHTRTQLLNTNLAAECRVVGQVLISLYANLAICRPTKCSIHRRSFLFPFCFCFCFCAAASSKPRVLCYIFCTSKT